MSDEILKNENREAPELSEDFSDREYTIGDDTENDQEIKEPRKKTPVKRKKKMNKAVLLGLIAVLVLGAAFAGWYFFLRPGINFSTTRPVAEAGEEFDTMSIVESVRGGSLSDVSAYGPKGALAKGVYKYSYSFRGRSYEVTVTVKDTKAPVLTLKPEDKLVFNDREEIKPEAIVDAEDFGKVTLNLDAQGNDLSVPGMYEVIVKAEDEDKNTSEIRAKIRIEAFDTEPPVIKGAEEAWVSLGDSFDIMAGVSASDNKDPAPSLTADANGLNTGVEGTYTVIYTAKDAYGNTTVKERKVIVYQPAQTVYYTPGYDSSVYWDATGEWGQPYLVAVNRAHCTVTVYGQDGNGNYTVPVKAMACSVGREGHETPISMNVVGQRFHSAWRAEWCYMVDGSYGRYAISIDTSLAPNEYDRWGIMFHSVCYYSQDIWKLEYDEYNKLGSPASLGCIRLCVGDEMWLYDNCPEGFPIIIYDDWSSPGPLGKPDPIRIDVNDERRGWDPTDPHPNNPWND